VDAPDQQEALTARITLLARDRDVWAHELEGKAAQVARLRSKEDAIRDFQAHVSAEHGSMQAWGDSLIRQLLLILDAWIEVWQLRAVQEGKTPDRAYLHVNMPLSGERRAALTRLLRAEHVYAATGLDTDGNGVDTDQADQTPAQRSGDRTFANPGRNGRDCAECSFARSTIYT
jgi:hypothetical protein